MEGSFSPPLPALLGMPSTLQPESILLLKLSDLLAIGLETRSPDLASAASSGGRTLCALRASPGEFGLENRDSSPEEVPLDLGLTPLPSPPSWPWRHNSRRCWPSSGDLV